MRVSQDFAGLDICSLCFFCHGQILSPQRGHPVQCLATLTEKYKRTKFLAQPTGFFLVFYDHGVDDWVPL